MLEEYTTSIMLCSRLEILAIAGSVIPHQFIIQPHVVKLKLERSGADIERIPDCIKDLHTLETLAIFGCPKLVSLPELPRSLETLIVYNCESLETLVVPFPNDSQIRTLHFPNCFKLDPKVRRAIIQQKCWSVCLPGRDIPAKFNHRAIGNSLTISSNGCLFKMCVMFSPKSEMECSNSIELMCRISINGCPCPTKNYIFSLYFGVIQSEHLAIFYSEIFREDEQYREILFEFSSSSQDIEIIECGVQIFRDIFDYGIHLPSGKQLAVKQFVEDGVFDESIAPAIVETMVDLGKTPECIAAIEKIVYDYNWSLMTKNLIEDYDGRPSKKRKRRRKR